MDTNENVFLAKDTKGLEKEYEIIYKFDSEQTKKSYLVYTDNTKDESGSLRVYANVYDPNGASMNLLPIESQEEWNTIEAILSKLEETRDNNE